MNNLSISYDGRITAWNSKTFTPRSIKRPLLKQSKEWSLFCELPAPAKEEFLENMGSSHVAISDKTDGTPKERAKRGSKGITALGRSRVRCGAQWLEDTYGVKNLSFLTCTLPPKALAAYTPETWAVVVNRFGKLLSYHLERAKLSKLLVAVTEIQTHRWRAEKDRPPVHLHVVFQGRQKYSSWVFRPAFFQELWESACESVWDVHSDWSASTRVEQLRSSSVSYLGKYMSKGLGGSGMEDSSLFPSSWYSVSLRLRRICDSHKIRLSGALAVAYHQYFKDSEMLRWVREVIQTEPETGHVWLMGWVAALRLRKDYLSIVEDIRDAIWLGSEAHLTSCVTL